MFGRNLPHLERTVALLLLGGRQGNGWSRFHLSCTHLRWRWICQAQSGSGPAGVRTCVLSASILDWRSSSRWVFYLGDLWAQADYRSSVLTLQLVRYCHTPKTWDFLIYLYTGKKSSESSCVSSIEDGIFCCEDFCSVFLWYLVEHWSSCQFYNPVQEVLLFEFVDLFQQSWHLSYVTFCRYDEKNDIFVGKS